MRTIKTNKNSRCPKCQAMLDKASDPLGVNTPSVGDYSICLYCNAVLQFGIGLTLHKVDKTNLSSSLLKKLQNFQRINKMRSLP